MEKTERKLTLKQRKFIKGYLETGNASEAARRAGYKWRCQGSENLSKPMIKNAFIELMDKHGLTDDRVIKKLDELLEAKRQISANITYGDADGKTTDFIEVTDNPIQFKTAELLLRVKSLIGDENRNLTIDQSQHLTQIVLADKIKEARERIIDGEAIDVKPAI